MSFKMPLELLRLAGIQPELGFVVNGNGNGNGAGAGAGAAVEGGEPVAIVARFCVMRHTPAAGPEACQEIVRMISEHATTRKWRPKSLRCGKLTG